MRTAVAVVTTITRTIAILFGIILNSDITATNNILPAVVISRLHIHCWLLLLTAHAINTDRLLVVASFTYTALFHAH